MGDKKDELCYIFRRETESVPGSGIIKEKQLTVQGKSLEEVEEIYNKHMKNVFKDE